MTSLLERIGKRTVLVDACVSPRLAKALRAVGLSVRHMNEINRRMPDAHIEYLVLLPTDVLITHDRMFARFLGPRKAILLRQRCFRRIDWTAFASEESGVGMAQKYGFVLLPFLLFIVVFGRHRTLAYCCTTYGNPTLNIFLSLLMWHGSIWADRNSGPETLSEIRVNIDILKPTGVSISRDEGNWDR